VQFFRHRVAYLEQQLAFQKGTPAARDWMGRELSAIKWVLECIENTFDSEA
jgi:hypothetical protein